MLRLIACLVLLSTFAYSPRSVGAAADYSDSDKQSHVAAGFLLTSASYLVLRNARLNKWEALFTSVAITAVVGVAKEVNDTPLRTDDLEADALGMGGAFVLLFAVDWSK